MVTDVFVELGQTVSAGVPLVRVAQLDRVIVETAIAEVDIASVQTGQKAIVRTRTFPDKEFTGTVSEIALSTDPMVLNYTVEITIPNGERLAASGHVHDGRYRCQGKRRCGDGAR